MAKNASVEAPETVLPDNGGKRSGVGASAGYLALVEWIRGLEESNETTRAIVIHTTDENAPAEEFLKYSRPIVKVGSLDGYEKPDGSVVPFK